MLSVVLTSRLPAATVGAVIPILGQAGALVYDNTHKLLFVSNSTQNRIEVYSQTDGQLLAPIPVGLGPFGIAISPENGVLVVCNSQDTFLTLIDLSTLRSVGTIPVKARLTANPEKPFSVAAMAGGIALISTNLGLQRVDIAAKTTTPISITDFPTPVNSNLVASGDGKVVLGQGSGIAFLYNQAIPNSTIADPSAPPGGFEQFRNTINSGLLIADQTGSQFVIGDSKFDRQLFQTNAINPLAIQLAPIGGVAFSADGRRVYVGYNQSPRAQVEVLSSTNLNRITSFQVPETIAGPMITDTDGSHLYAISISGITTVDLTALPSLPNLQLGNKFLFFSFQACNLGPATQNIRIINSGGGSFTWSASASGSNITLDSSAGNGPAELNVTVDPSRFAFRGTAIIGSIRVVSDESVGGDQSIPIVLNLRNPDQVGTVFPVEGYLTDILVDDARQRIYLTNSSKNQIEVFSTEQQGFLPPVSVGAIPKAITFSNDKKQLFVATLGADYITELDADSLGLTSLIRIPHPPPVPNFVAGTHALSVAQAANGALLIVGTTLENPSRGTVYRLDSGASNATAFPLLGTSPNVVNGMTFLSSTGNGAFVLLAEAAGAFRLYDGSTGNFAIARPFSGTVTGNVAASEDGSYYHAMNQVLNSALVPRDVIPSGLPGTNIVTAGFAFASASGAGYRGIRPSTFSANTPAPRIEKLDLAASKVVSYFNIAEALISIPSSPFPLLAIQRQLAVDREEKTLYGISDSGLIVIPLRSSGSSAGPQINPGGVVNGASFTPAPAPVAPGSIAAIFGSNLSNGVSVPDVLPLPVALGGTCITFDGVPAPLFYASPGQLNVQIPWELAGKATAQMAVSSGTLASQPISVNLAQRSPGIFTVSGDGQGAAAILHSSDFSLVTTSNPATIGESVSIYATGLGPTDPSVGTGVPAPDGIRIAPPTVTIGGASASVEFAGLAPGFVGLYQVNVRIPSNVPVGTSVPVSITAGTATSNRATIAIIPAH